MPPARLRCTRGPPGQLKWRNGEEGGREAGTKLGSRSEAPEFWSPPSRNDWLAHAMAGTHGGGQEGSAALTCQWHAGTKAAAAPWGIFLEAKEWVGTANLKVQRK